MRFFQSRGLLWAVFGFAALMAGQTLFAQAAPSLAEKVLGLNSGPMGIMIQVTIILLSIFMLGWAIECFVNVRRDKKVPPEVISALQGYIDEGDLEGALQFCESSPNIMTRIIGAPLSRMHSGWDAMQQAADNQFSVENSKLNAHISPLSLIAAIGPMMGLFGTVSGMVGAFDQMSTAGEDMSPAAVAGDIGLALMSTVMGLVVAIPGMFFFWFFNNRVTQIMDDVGLVTDEMMDTLHGYVQQ